MADFREITPQQFNGNFFQLIGSDWMLIAAQHKGKVNMMTASWGGVGILWHKPVVYIFVRPQRFTKTLLDASEGFSCTFFAPEYRQQLTLCGSKSGKDIDKISECGFHVNVENGVPYFEEANVALLCQKLYRQPMAREAFFEQGLVAEHYADGDFHELYVGEIERVLVK